MSSDNQFTALGPAAVGFQTHGANIATGAFVQGTDKGAVIEGQNLGASVTCNAGDTLIVTSNGGRGGTFNSGDVDRAQVSFFPFNNGGIGRRIPVNPEAFANDGIAVRMPIIGQQGDLLVMNVAQKTSMFLCVHASISERPAAWQEVLLGPILVSPVGQ
jgi:hypothetical protein